MRHTVLFLTLLLACIICEGRRHKLVTDKIETWTGRWLPERISTTERLLTESHDDSTENVPMGVLSNKCDDGKTNLTLDWDGSLEDYLCLHPRIRFVPDALVKPNIQYESIPKMYHAAHICMDTSIIYDRPIPTYGEHRTLWPVFGEYKFLPKQRWLHSLEHGGIVMLYNPCADLYEIKKLKYLVKTCLRRHVITPDNSLDSERPLELVAWGVRLSMSYVNSDIVRQFIQENALKGPEQLAEEGQFEDQLVEKAKIISDFEDGQLCPQPLSHD